LSYSIGLTEDKNASKLLVPDDATGAADIDAVGFDVTVVAEVVVVDNGGGGNNNDGISVGGNWRGSVAATGTPGRSWFSGTGRRGLIALVDSGDKRDRDESKNYKKFFGYCYWKLVITTRPHYEALCVQRARLAT
jgi:hypothetical protein